MERASLTKATAYRIEAMESARLIWYKHHIPWADQIIQSLDQPPVWILELATAKYIGDVQKILRSFVFSEPFEQVDESRYYRDYLAALFLRYKRRDLSWASFLEAAGHFADCSEGGDHPCEYFFALLNDFEDADFAYDLEEDQARQIEADYKSTTDDLLPLYLKFRVFYPKQKGML